MFRVAEVSAAALFAAILASVVPAPAEAMPRARIVGRPACFTPALLQSALVAHARHADGAIVIRPRADRTNWVDVNYYPPGSSVFFRRTLDAKDCDALPAAIATLIEGWWRQMLRGEVVAVTSPDAVVPSQARQAPPAQSAPAAQPPAAATPARGTQMAPRSAFAPAPVAPANVAGPPEPAAVPEAVSSSRSVGGVDATHEPPPASMSPVALALFASQGRLLGDVRPLGAAARVEFGLWKRMAIGLQYRWEAPRTELLKRASLTGHNSAADVVFQWALHEPGASGFRLHVGVGALKTVSAAASETEEPTSRWDPELVAGLELHLRVAGGLFVRGFAGGEWRVPPEAPGDVDLDRSDRVMLRAGAGAGWAF